MFFEVYFDGEEAHYGEDNGKISPQDDLAWSRAGFEMENGDTKPDDISADPTPSQVDSTYTPATTPTNEPPDPQIFYPVDEVEIPVNPDTRPPEVYYPSAPESSNSSPMQGDSSHVYVGTENGNDVWRLWDGWNWIQWSVEAGHDSREVIAGSMRNLGSTVAATQQTTNVTPSNPTQGDSRHKYQGTDSTGDIWSLTDEKGNVVTWHVPINHDSREVIPGTIVTTPPAAVSIPNTPPVNTTNVTGTGGGSVSGTAAPSNTTQPSSTVTTAVPLQGASLPANAGPQADSRHKYVGRDGRGDVWQLFDGANVIEWAVRIGDPSNAAIPGTVRNLGAPSNMTVAQASDLAPPSSRGVQSDARHVYVGRDARGDVWQIFDGTNVIEWAVNPGRPSAEMIPNSARNLGPPSPGTVAQATPPPAGGGNGKTVGLTEGTSNSVLWISLGITALKLFHAF